MTTTPERVATTIVAGFERYIAEFRRLTLRARRHFEQCDWPGAQADWVARLDSFGRAMRDTLAAVSADPVPHAAGRRFWVDVRHAYRDAIALRHDAELGETFFNSIVRRLLAASEVDPAVEFADQRPIGCPLGPIPPVTCTFHRETTIESLATKVLQNFRFGPPYEDARRDSAAVARALERAAPAVQSIEMAIPVFFRNKGAYLVGRLKRPDGSDPIVIALLNGPGGVWVDAVLTTEDDASVVFSFTRSYFYVDTFCPRDLVRFLHELMPRKPIAELYTAIGHNKHGKTELYRSLRQHLAATDDRFDFARGARGMVMIAFTMPSYDIVFKVLRDRASEPKTCTRREVMGKYELVFRHDRAGRLVDAQEFEHLSFDRARFAPALLDELTSAAEETVAVDGDRVVFRHVYTERRVTPLDLYLREADPGAVRDAVIDYGRALRDLAATNIFPGDLLTKNFGVTRHGRVVFYDYDEISILTDCCFRRLPAARSFEEEIAGEPWFSVGDHDVFPEEFLAFLGFDRESRDLFVLQHGDLLTPEFWRGMQERHRSGAVADLYPYSPARRLRAAAERPSRY